MASGILILSQNGRIIQRLISPKHHLEKQYLVEVSSDLDLDTKKEQTAFADGNIAIRNRKTNELERCSPARLEYIGPRTARVWLAEGRYHQLRRMFAALDNEVVGIHRESVGPIQLDSGLEPGEWRELTEQEIQTILPE
mmetsp:Transcript_17753/g.29390  ORF Transcript_17753/g.29390 Transcript_17753/m.29390 type:complete len:139 (-) Transcript_17753:176-592(-)